MPTACVRCEYPRAGLTSGSPCPECGAAHDADTFLVRGWSGAGTGLWAIATGGLLLAASVSATFVGGRGVACAASTGVLLGSLIAGTGVMQRLQLRQGGDIVWAFLPEGIEVRVRGVRTSIPWRLLDELRRRRRWRRWRGLQARSTALFLGGHPIIWLRDQDELVDRMMEVARRRMAPSASS